MRTNKQQKGFAMPIVIIVSASALLLILALSQAIQSMRTYTTDLYYTRLAEEAAEAGTSYALACLEENNRIQAWGNTPTDYLTQNSDCKGNQNAFPGSSVIALSRELQSRFQVGDLDTSNTNSVQISAKGFVDVKIGGGTTVAKTYESTLKRTVTWTVILDGTRSVSGTYRTCAIMSGSVYCWGYNAYGQLGNGQFLGYGNIEKPSSIDSSTPVRVKREVGKLAGKMVVDIFSAQYHSCALTSIGKVYCWGQNANGQLGNGTLTSTGTPVEVGGLLADKKVTAIGGTANSTCAVADGKIYCWGNNSSGLVGIGNTTGTHSTPRLVTAGNTSTTLPSSYVATAISTSGSRSGTICAIADGKAYCWGRNGIGEVGDNTTTLRTIPTKVVDTGVLSGKTITAISQDGYASSATGGFAHVCVVADSKAYCWGENGSGQLGRGDFVDSRVPVAVNASGVLKDKVVTDIAVGLSHSCALASGEVYCWGAGGYGQVGDNSFSGTYRPSPVKVYQEKGALLGVGILRIGAGANRGCAVVDSGKSYCWGLNGSGQIGDGSTDNRAKPTESSFLRPKNNEYLF